MAILSSPPPAIQHRANAKPRPCTDTIDQSRFLLDVPSDKAVVAIQTGGQAHNAIMYLTRRSTPWNIAFGICFPGVLTDTIDAARADRHFGLFKRRSLEMRYPPRWQYRLPLVN